MKKFGIVYVKDNIYNDNVKKTIRNTTPHIYVFTIFFQPSFKDLFPFYSALSLLFFRELPHIISVFSVFVEYSTNIVLTKIRQVKLFYRIFVNYKDMETEFKSILNDFIKENGLTVSEFARQIGVRPSQVSEWLRGKAKPGYDSLKAMAKAFNISANYFLGLTDEY